MNPQPTEVDPRIAIAQGLANKLLESLMIFERRVQDKYDYYNADNDFRDFGISTPKKLRNERPGVGWASRCVNTLSDRVVFDGFANDTQGINDLMSQVGAMTVIQQSKHDTFIGGCAFVAVSDGDDDGEKLLVPFTAQEATGVIDQRTGLLRVGLAVTRWAIPNPLNQEQHKSRFAAQDFIVFTPSFTAVYENRSIVAIIDNPTGRCLLQPLTHRASANQPLGKSRITKTARRIVQEVGRLKRRQEIAEEFYALPQRYLLGVAEGATKDASVDNQIGKMIVVNKDEDGDSPTAGQFPQMSIDQFETAKKDKARDFCAETALTLRNLGYETGNPSNAESLSAMSDDLLLEANNSQAEMGEQIKNIATTLYMAIHGTDQVPDGLQNMIPAWKPIFQIDVGAVGDAVFKLSQAMPELIGTTAGYQLLGIGIRDAEKLAQIRAQNVANTKFMQPGGQ